MADWKDYNIQDEPTASTPLNTVTAEYLNGMASEVKNNTALISFAEIKPTVSNDFSVQRQVTVIKMGKTVFLSGKLTNSVSGKTIFTLPSYMRPSENITLQGGGLNHAGNIQVSSNGNVIRWGTGDVFLDGFSFLAI